MLLKDSTTRLVRLNLATTKTNSAALAQILAKDYNKAKNTLAAIRKDQTLILTT